MIYSRRISDDVMTANIERVKLTLPRFDLSKASLESFICRQYSMNPPFGIFSRYAVVVRQT